MENKLKKNILFQTVYQVLQIVIPLIITPYISRTLGASNIGIYSYTYSIAYYFVMIAMLGLANYGSRTIALSNNDKKDRSKTFIEIYLLQLICSLFTTTLYIIYLFVINKSYNNIFVIQLLYVISAAFDISWFYFGIEEVSPIVIRNLIIKLISLLGIFILVKKSSDLWIYTIILAGGQLLGNISMWISLRKRIMFSSVKLKDIFKHFMPNFILFIPVIAVSLYKTMDKIMLGMLTEESQVGFYTNSENLINVPIGFIIAIGSVMLPRITKLNSEGNIKKCITYFRISLTSTICFTSAMAFGIAAISPIFVPIYYGDGYSNCIFLLEGQSIIMFFIAWANIVRTQYLLPNKKEKAYIISIFCGAFINIVLNILLIPKLEAMGALIATIVAEIIVCVIQSIYTNKYINMIKCLRENLIFIYAGFIMFIIIRIFLKSYSISIISLIKLVLIGGIIYIFIIFIFYYVFKKIFNKNIFSFKEDVNDV